MFLVNLSRLPLSHLGIERLGALFDFLLGQVCHVRAHTPGMTEGIDEMAHPVSPEHISHRHRGFGASIDSLLEDFVNVGNVKIDASGVRAYRLWGFAAHVRELI